MASIQLQVLHPDGHALRQTFAHGPVPFGREADNLLVLAGPYVSRRHGVLHAQGESWLLENLSDNGTFINGKRVRKKPALLRQGDLIRIGDQDVLRVEAILPAQDQTGASGVTAGQAGAASTAPASASSQASAYWSSDGAVRSAASRRKMTLWISLASFWIVVLGLLVFVQPLLDKRDSTQAVAGVELRPDQIARAVKLPPADIRAGVSPNERLATAHLQQAREMAARLDARLDAPYQAYRDYQRALAYLGQDTLTDSRDLHDFLRIEEMLIEGVSRRYYDGYAKMRTHNYRAAETAFRDLLRYFPATDNPLTRHVENHRKDIGPKLRQRR